ncbi:MAG: hypothetical protein ACLFNQ_09755 [Spirochaetaceae bacterium]
MRLRTAFGLAAVLLLVLAGCATPGTSVSEVDADLGTFVTGDVELGGTVGRGVPVTGTSMYVYQYGDAENTVAVLSPIEAELGSTRVVAGRLVPFDGEVTDEVTAAIEAHLEANGVGEDTLGAATDRSQGLIRTFTIANGARFFVLEDAPAE